VRATNEKVLPLQNGTNQTGTSVTQRNIGSDGTRQSTAKSFLQPARGRPNLTIVTGAHVSKVLLEGGVAKGVELVGQDGGNCTQVAARKEVVVSGGAIGSPQILQLSGLGPADVLAAAGVPQASELPVGRNLQDHILVPIVFETIGGAPMSEARALSPDQLIEYQLLDGAGFLSSSGVDMMAFWLTEEGKKQGYTFNDAQIHALQGQPLNEALSKNLGTDYETHWKGVPEDGVYIAPSLLHPKSVGTVNIRDENPLTHPAIQPWYLTDPYDIAAMIEICKTTMKMTETPAWKKYFGKQFQHPSMPAGMELNTDEFFEWLVCTWTKT
jgi:choline dehydrogenase